jgi:hypothetical protein
MHEPSPLIVEACGTLLIKTLLPTLSTHYLGVSGKIGICRVSLFLLRNGYVTGGDFVPAKPLGTPTNQRSYLAAQTVPGRLPSEAVQKT